MCLKSLLPSLPGIRLFLWAFLFLVNFPSSAKAMEETWQVAVSPSAPFVLYDPQTPSTVEPPEGFSVDLWLQLAQEMGVQTQWRYESSVAEVFYAVSSGQADLGLVAFPPETLQLGLEVLVIQSQSTFRMLAQGIGKFFASVSMNTFLIPMLVFLIACHLRLWVDRRQPEAERKFPENYFSGLGEAAWWNLCMLIDWMGGEEKHGLARAFDLMWHLAGIMLLSGFIGLLTATLTLESVEQRIQELKDLQGGKVAILKRDSSYVKPALNKLRLDDVIEVSDLAAATELLLSGQVAGVVDHSGSLRAHAASLEEQDSSVEFKVLSEPLNQQRYAFVMAPGHARREEMEALLGQSSLPRGLQPSLANELAAKWQLPLN